MSNARNFFGTPEVAQQLGIGLKALQMWLSRHPEYRPTLRISGDDLLWSVEDIERVKEARNKKRRKVASEV